MPPIQRETHRCCYASQTPPRKAARVSRPIHPSTPRVLAARSARQTNVVVHHLPVYASYRLDFFLPNGSLALHARAPLPRDRRAIGECPHRKIAWRRIHKTDTSRPPSPPPACAPHRDAADEATRSAYISQTLSHHPAGSAEYAHQIFCDTARSNDADDSILLRAFE